MNRDSLIVISILIVAIFGFIFITGFKTGGDAVSVENSEIRDGVQYITINAQGGYSPRVTEARSGIPTKLIMKTNGTYDCSLSLVIRSIGFQKILPQTGETEIDLGIPKVGVPLEGVCGMGMYNFRINFI
ncbi:MAG: hypothetical protein V4699_03405 [Patescibacteria group bacterium]